MSKLVGCKGGNISEGGIDRVTKALYGRSISSYIYTSWMAEGDPHTLASIYLSRIPFEEIIWCAK